MPPWAYCEALNQEQVTVGDSEAHHLINVLRLKTGALVTLFDGRGTVAEAVIHSLSRRDVTFQIQQRSHLERKNDPVITLAVSPPKGDRLKWLVEKLTELGVHQLQLLDCHRSVTVPGETRIDKLKASVVAACKQSRRPVLMDLQPMASLQQVIESGRQSDTRLFLAHPAPGAAHSLKVDTSQSATILVGPEGGFTDEEVQFAIDAGAQQIAWPGTILRIETAAIVFGTLAIAALHGLSD